MEISGVRLWMERREAIRSHREIHLQPDSKHVAYGVRLGYREFVVMDGEEGKQYYELGTGLIFSPDSKHLAYGQRWH